MLFTSLGMASVDVDIDLGSKIWGRWAGNACGGSLHEDFIENRVME